ncbi:hypothetical protein EVAR_68710_1 [Eumeta japonica]|uniref:Uncharacterized protein n=1 Tax=Eumeta variegata TaxID=151549 RepID=A0A4C2A2N3_EUMVA|nr:hypothetical protein EVAR_68710_1 [Eumeta japonica]
MESAHNVYCPRCVRDGPRSSDCNVVSKEPIERTEYELLTHSPDFGAARLDPYELRIVVPYTHTLSERSAELHATRLIYNDLFATKQILSSTPSHVRGLGLSGGAIERAYTYEGEGAYSAEVSVARGHYNASAGIHLRLKKKKYLLRIPPILIRHSSPGVDIVVKIYCSAKAAFIVSPLGNRILRRYLFKFENKKLSLRTRFELCSGWPMTSVTRGLTA